MPYAGSYIWKVRQKIGHDPLLMPSADAIAVRDDGKLLMIFNNDWQNWFFPGGYAELGQSSSECAARELLEEGGLDAEPSDLIPIAFASGHSAEYPNGDVTYPFTQIFIAQKWQNSSGGIDTSEVSKREWFTIDEIKSMKVNSYMQHIIRAYEAYMKTKEYQMIQVQDEQ